MVLEWIPASLILVIERLRPATNISSTFRAKTWPCGLRNISDEEHPPGEASTLTKFPANLITLKFQIRFRTGDEISVDGPRHVADGWRRVLSWVRQDASLRNILSSQGGERRRNTLPEVEDLANKQSFLVTLPSKLPDVWFLSFHQAMKLNKKTNYRPLKNASTTSSLIWGSSRESRRGWLRGGLNRLSRSPRIQRGNITRHWNPDCWVY